MLLRPAEPSDRDAIITLIDAVYREHGDQICLAGADADLLDIDGHYHRAGGAFVVLHDRGEVVGTHAVLPLDASRGLCTFRRLYLAPQWRGSGWGQSLMTWAFETARDKKFRHVEFWSDTRFTRAHRFFRRCGFIHDGEVREMSDGAMPYRELFFYRDLTVANDK